MDAPDRQLRHGDDVRHTVILTVGAWWGAAYEIDAHSSAARAVGIPDEAIDAIIVGDEPAGLTAAAQVAHQLTVGLLQSRQVPDELYRDAVTALGEAGLISILCLIGQYQTISSILVCFQVPVPVPAGGSAA